MRNSGQTAGLRRNRARASSIGAQLDLTDPTAEFTDHQQVQNSYPRDRQWYNMKRCHHCT